MTWPQALLLVGYVVIAAWLWCYGDKLFGKSPAGRQAVPIVAVFWPIGVVLLVAVAIMALIDAAFDRAAEWLGRPEA